MSVPNGIDQKTWTTALERGRALVQQEQDTAWAWGDLVNEVCPANNTAAHTDKALERFAEAIGYDGDVSTLRVRRAVSAAWAPVIRITGVPWSIHQILMALPDRADVIRSRDTWTAAEARAFVQARKEAEERDASLRYEIMEHLSSVREKQEIEYRKAHDLLTKLKGPVPQDEVNGVPAMAEQIRAVRDAADLLLQYVEGATNADDELRKMLEAEQ